MYFNRKRTDTIRSFRTLLSRHLWNIQSNNSWMIWRKSETIHSKHQLFNMLLKNPKCDQSIKCSALSSWNVSKNNQRSLHCSHCRCYVKPANWLIFSISWSTEARKLLTTRNEAIPYVRKNTGILLMTVNKWSQIQLSKKRSWRCGVQREKRSWIERNSLANVCISKQVI